MNTLNIQLLQNELNNHNFLDEYEWKHDGCYLPPDEELVIYELHVGDFSADEDNPNTRGQFKHIIQKIDYLKKLGVNASMPSFSK